jgi:hypothetical protein
MFAQKSRIAAGIVLASILAIAGPGVGLAAKKPAKPQPQRAHAAAPKLPVVMGTQQFSGDQAQLGQTYTLGKVNPINIAINSVAYSVNRISIGPHHYLPTSAEKLLVIQLKFQNPQRTERLVRFDTANFTAVDDKDTNREGAGMIGVPETQDTLSIRLKPGQVKNAYTYIVVPADAVIPKLVVKSPDDKVLRYDLHGKVAPLVGPAADPQDATGATALSVVPVALNMPAQIGNRSGPAWDVTVESVAYVDGKLGDISPAKGSRLFVMTAMATNRNPGTWTFRFDTLRPCVKTTDEEAIDAKSVLLHATANRTVDYKLAMGASGHFRMYFQVPSDAKLKTLDIRTRDDDRAAVIDISGV